MIDDDNFQFGTYQGKIYTFDFESSLIYPTGVQSEVPEILSFLKQDGFSLYESLVMGIQQCMHKDVNTYVRDLHIDNCTEDMILE